MIGANEATRTVTDMKQRLSEELVALPAADEDEDDKEEEPDGGSMSLDLVSLRAELD